MSRARPLVEVSLLELPVLRRVVQAGEEPRALFVVGDVEEHLHDRRSRTDRPRLESVDLLVALRPHPGRDQVVDAHDEHVLVLRAVEDPDLARARHRVPDPPQVRMAPLLGRRRLEAGDPAPLRVDPGDHVTDDAVLPTRVGALEHEQQRTTPLRVQPLLQVEEPRPVLVDRLQRVRLRGLAGLPVEPGRGARVDAGELHPAPRRDPEQLARRRRRHH